MEHSAGEYVIVSQETNVVVLFAMCNCGDDNCAWTMTAAKASAINSKGNE